MAELQMQSGRAAEPEPEYLKGLNAAQREAVLSTEGPVLVLAGAGTGKTRVLTTRLAHLLYTRKARPSDVLAVTFTNKAAQEMRERVSNMLGGRDVAGWWLGTFHALAARMLRRHAEAAGLTSQFSIIDTDDQQRLLKQILEAEKIDTKKFPPKLAAAWIDKFKNQALRPEEISYDMVGDRGGPMLKVYKTYQERLKTLNACDFGDLLLHMVTIFRTNPDILEQYHTRLRYILVDEYQDTNVAQYLWLRLLAQGIEGPEGPNLCCVGDEDQSIYGWRGAEVGNILRFERDFPGAKIIRLEENYRSTDTILNAASGVIAHNESRLGKTLRAGIPDPKAEKVKVAALWDGEGEARWVAQEIERLHTRNGIGLNQIAILVRAGHLTRAFEERFLQIGLPYKVIGGLRFYERAEIRDALAYCRVTVRPDDDLALERILNTPKRGIGPSTFQQLVSHARTQGLSLHDAIRDLCQTEGALKPKIRSALMALIEDFARWRAALDTPNHADLAAQILEESGYTAMWQAENTPDAPTRLDNLKEFVSSVGEFENLPAFLEHVALVMDNAGQENREAVSLMTLHGAKGLEFDVVFLPGWEEGLFPSQRSLDEGGLKSLEEERRLAYVGLTRARKKAYISHAATRRIYGNRVDSIPSRFIEELPEPHVEFTAEEGLPFNAGGSAYGVSHQWQGRGALLEDVSYRVEKRNPFPGTSIRAGTRVRHGQYGEGTVIHADGEKLDVEFSTGERKRLMAGFVEVVD